MCPPVLGIILLGIPDTIAVSRMLYWEVCSRPRKVNMDYSSRGAFFLTLLIPCIHNSSFFFFFFFIQFSVTTLRSKRCQGYRIDQDTLLAAAEPCKFPPSHRRRFSLIADRSPYRVINVSYGDRERVTRQWGQQGIETGREQSNGEGRKREGDWSAGANELTYL